MAATRTRAKMLDFGDIDVAGARKRRYEKRALVQTQAQKKAKPAAPVKSRSAAAEEDDALRYSRRQRTPAKPWWIASPGAEQDEDAGKQEGQQGSVLLVKTKSKPAKKNATSRSKIAGVAREKGAQLRASSLDGDAESDDSELGLSPLTPSPSFGAAEAAKTAKKMHKGVIVFRKLDKPGSMEQEEGSSTSDARSVDFDASAGADDAAAESEKNAATSDQPRESQQADPRYSAFIGKRIHKFGQQADSSSTGGGSSSLTGTLTEFDEGKGTWTVRYDCGREEKLDWFEVLQLLISASAAVATLKPTTPSRGDSAASSPVEAGEPGALKGAGAEMAEGSSLPGSPAKNSQQLESPLPVRRINVRSAGVIVNSAVEIATPPPVFPGRGRTLYCEEEDLARASKDGSGQSGNAQKNDSSKGKHFGSNSSSEDDDNDEGEDDILGNGKITKACDYVSEMCSLWSEAGTGTSAGIPMNGIAVCTPTRGAVAPHQGVGGYTLPCVSPSLAGGVASLNERTSSEQLMDLLATPLSTEVTPESKPSSDPTEGNALSGANQVSNDVNDAGNNKSSARKKLKLCGDREHLENELCNLLINKKIIKHWREGNDWACKDVSGKALDAYRIAELEVRLLSTAKEARNVMSVTEIGNISRKAHMQWIQLKEKYSCDEKSPTRPIKGILKKPEVSKSVAAKRVTFLAEFMRENGSAPSTDADAESPMTTEQVVPLESS